MLIFITRSVAILLTVVIIVVTILIIRIVVIMMTDNRDSSPSPEPCTLPFRALNASTLNFDVFAYLSALKALTIKGLYNGNPRI